MYMVMLVLDLPDKLDAVLAAWSAAGVRGATIAETAGIYRRQMSRNHIPARYAAPGLGAAAEQGNYTLWAIVPDREMAQRCLAAAEGVVGDLDGPNTGVLAAWPLDIVKGVPSQDSSDVCARGDTWSG